MAAGIQHAHDVRVAQALCDFGFAQKALARGAVVGSLRQQHFDGDRPAKGVLQAKEDLRRSAAADLLRQPVAGDFHVF